MRRSLPSWSGISSNALTGAESVSSTDRSRIRTALLVTISCLVACSCVFACSGCARRAAPSRLVEREETIGKARVRLRSNLSPARATLGDRIGWRLTATLGEGAKPGALFLGAPPASMELDSSRAPLQRSERSEIVYSREYLLRGFDLGAIELPRAALPVFAAGTWDTLEFPPDTFFVDSLTQAATGNLRPDRGPIDTPLRPVDYVVAALVVLLAAAAIVFLIRWIRGRRKKRQLKAAPAPPDPPETILLRSLDELERELYSVPRDVFYERLSQALRSYAHAVTGAPAPDLTTTELARELARDRRVHAEGREALIAALTRADLAKFARFEDEESEAKSILNQARSISGRLV